MAKKFRFRFEPILGLKEKEEEAKKLELGTATKKLKHEEEALIQLYHKRQTLTDQLHESARKVIQVKQLQQYATKISFMDELIDKQKVAVDKCENYVDYSRTGLIEAKKQSKIYNLLREKEYETYQYIQLKDEEALIDQIVSHKSASK